MDKRLISERRKNCEIEAQRRAEGCQTWDEKTQKHRLAEPVKESTSGWNTRRMNRGMEGGTGSDPTYLLLLPRSSRTNQRRLERFTKIRLTAEQEEEWILVEEVMAALNGKIR